jgi:nucleoid-associated protein YgaU
VDGPPPSDPIPAAPRADLLQPVAPASRPPAAADVTPLPAAGGATPETAAPGAAADARPLPGEPPRLTAIQIAQAEPPQAAAPRPLPIGAPVNASSPPIVVPFGAGAVRPLASGAAQVDSFDEELYRVRPGDNFASVSRHFYQTDKYGQALLLFNRNHPQTSAGIRQEPPVLQPGQMIFIPPTHVLERRYGPAIPELTPLPGPTGPVPAPAEVSGQRPSYASPAAAAALPRYRVVEKGGATLWEIATATLGNGERWREIHKLNPSHPAESRVPFATVLQLPADARVPASNQPQ